VRHRPDHRRGQKGQQHADHEAARRRIGEHADEDFPQFDEIDREDGEHGAELDQHREGLAEFLIVEAEEPLHQQQVAG
jgi:hypothetical protein